MESIFPWMTDENQKKVVSQTCKHGTKKEAPLCAPKAASSALEKLARSSSLVARTGEKGVHPRLQHKLIEPCAALALGKADQDAYCGRIRVVPQSNRSSNG